jgi:hypothetical protein
MRHKDAGVDGGYLSIGYRRALFWLDRSRTIARGLHLPFDGYECKSMSGCCVRHQLWAAGVILGPANGGGRRGRPVQRTKKQAVTS